MPYVHQYISTRLQNGGQADGLDGFGSGSVCGIRPHRDRTLYRRSARTAQLQRCRCPLP
jgi:hypothetical protein